MTDLRWQTSMKNLGKALDRLAETLNEPLDKNDYVLDACIQRFEFVIELFWKTFKHLLASQGAVTQLPKEALQQAFAAKWVNDEQMWLNMLRDRNLTSHTYHHDQALEIYQNIKTYYPEMRQVYDYLQQTFKE